VNKRRRLIVNRTITKFLDPNALTSITRSNAQSTLPKQIAINQTNHALGVKENVLPQQLAVPHSVVTR
jgi:hypothetical protein